MKKAEAVTTKKMKNCPECGSKRGEPRGISYTDNSVAATHPYHDDHMNAHICANAWHER